jgi:hypothetical protein
VITKRRFPRGITIPLSLLARADEVINAPCSKCLQALVISGVLVRC